MPIKINCPECESENVVPYDGEIKQCNCGYIAGADEFEEGCPICGMVESVQEYDGRVSQCADCNYLADSSEFISDTY